MYAVADSTLAGTARNRSLGNMTFRSSSVAQEPSTRLPPEEKGEIAELCGYTNMNFFYRKFKEMYGMSPKQYRGI